jgi:hypothetical protein
VLAAGQLFASFSVHSKSFLRVGALR